MSLLPNGMLMSALAYRPVWIRYGKFLPWHVIRGDIALIADLRSPVCGWRVGTLPIAETALSPSANTPVCTACLADSLRVKEWRIEGYRNDPPEGGSDKDGQAK